MMLDVHFNDTSYDNFFIDMCVWRVGGGGGCVCTRCRGRWGGGGGANWIWIYSDYNSSGFMTIQLKTGGQRGVSVWWTSRQKTFQAGMHISCSSAEALFSTKLWIPETISCEPVKLHISRRPADALFSILLWITEAISCELLRNSCSKEKKRKNKKPLYQEMCVKVVRTYQYCESKTPCTMVEFSGSNEKGPTMLIQD